MSTEQCTESELSAELTLLADSPAPPSRVDPGAALVVGRRRLRRRRAATTGATVALVAVVTVTAISLPHGTGAVATPATSATTPARPTAPAVAANDPLVGVAHFGWLPPYVAPEAGYDSGFDHGIDSLALGPLKAAGDDNPHIWLNLYPAGVTPTVDKAADGRTQYAVSAPDVHGSPAYWVTADRSDPTNNGDMTLRWKTGTGQWAEIHGYYLPMQGVQATMARIAEGVGVGNRAIPLPYYVTGLPAGAKFEGISLSRPSMDVNGGPWGLGVGYALDGYQFGWRMSVNKGTPPAHDPGEFCRTIKGVDLCVNGQPGATMPAAMVAAGGLQGLLTRITPLGTDESTWTTSVVR
ncbi:hypothetical protein [Streptacidiphilus sp. EB129]|uniref:hypothetical protein n=1 Tax=Streptacidiphilus sp. EB129 TaxID=3156262 RepID=UPI003515BA26